MARELTSDPCGAFGAITFTLNVIEEFWAGIGRDFILNYGLRSEREIEHVVTLVKLEVCSRRFTVPKTHKSVLISSTGASKLSSQVIEAT